MLHHRLLCCSFQSTLPARGATLTSRSMASCNRNFNPRSPHGERQWLPTYKSEVTAFQSTLPARGATRLGQCAAIRPLISIHAPRTGSDRAGRAGVCNAGNFNPRSPHGERRRQLRRSGADADFNPRSPHGERHDAARCADGRVCISIHAPRTGSDLIADFLILLKKISIHAPRTGSDGKQSHVRRGEFHFNPRSPHGERRWSCSTPPEHQHFNPRSPHGERLCAA